MDIKLYVLVEFNVLTSPAEGTKEYSVFSLVPPYIIKSPVQSLTDFFKWSEAPAFTFQPDSLDRKVPPEGTSLFALLSLFIFRICYRCSS